MHLLFNSGIGLTEHFMDRLLTLFQSVDWTFFLLSVILLLLDDLAAEAG